MRKEGKKENSSKYILVLVAIVAIVALVALFKLGSNSKISDSRGELNFAQSLTGNVVATLSDCTDSDGGKQYGVLGVTTDARGQVKDICLDEIQLVENYCEPGSKLFKTEIKDVLSNFVCIDGASTPKTCTDTDESNPNNLLTFGSATDNLGKIQDKCTTNNQRLLEAICKNGKTAVNEIYCPFGCQNGICVEKCTDTDGGNTKQKGSVTYLSNDNGALAPKTENDKCKDGDNSKIMEMQCNGKNKGVPIETNCGTNFVCKEGVCITKCTDTEVNKKDVCIDKQKLNDFSCNTQKDGYTSKAVTCQYGCEIDKGQAKCIEKCTDTDDLKRYENDIINGEYSNTDEALYISLYLKGEAAGYNPIKTKQEKISDKCNKATKELTESYCDVKTNTLATKSTQCSQGCLNNGACNPELLEPKCIDSDTTAANDIVGSTSFDINKNNYINAKAAGTAKEYGTNGKVSVEKKDTCDTNGKLIESYCDLTTKKIKSVTYPCTTGTCKLNGLKQASCS